MIAVRSRSEVARFLDRAGAFDLVRDGHGEEVHLASGTAREGFADDGAGGTYFFCGEGGEGHEERPVPYADSERRAALIAIGLPELLRPLLSASWWRGCQSFTDTESGGLAAAYLEDMLDLAIRRDLAAVALGLGLPSPPEAPARLREVAAGRGGDCVLDFTPQGHPCEPLLPPEST